MLNVRILACVFYVLCQSYLLSQTSGYITAYQYFINADPGMGVAGNGAVIAVTPTTDLNQAISISLPGSLGKGIHQLYFRVKDEYGRWSLAERRSFYVTDVVSSVADINACQYFFGADPGLGVPGNGGVIEVTPTSDFNQTIAIPLSGSLANGIHQLYIRTRDESGHWSIAERRSFYITDVASSVADIKAYQYYFGADPGLGVPGNGGVIEFTPTSDFNQTIAIPLPGILGNGMHQLYIRTKNEDGRWSLAERRSFYITEVITTAANINAYQYFFDTDQGPGVPGNGAVVPVTTTMDYNQTIAITIPESLTNGIHQLYIRTRDENGRWSLSERRMFYINELIEQASDIASLEYYIDADPGLGNANPYPLAQTSDFDSTVTLGVPCLSTGIHYLYIRAIDTEGRWSIIERDTFSVTSEIEPSVVSPAGPVSICEGYSIVLFTTPVPGISYQWVESGNPIPGETGPSITVTAAGSYALRSICGSFVVSNTVEVSSLPQNTYYADTDNDGYGDATESFLDCEQPSGYVSNDDDCDDTNVSIHPNAAELCNLLDDDCDGTIDEGVQLTFYADSDGDSYGDPSNTTLACSVPSGYVNNDGDCDDSNANLHPGMAESCNVIDDNCNGTIDEGVHLTFYQDADGDGFGDPASTSLACTAPVGYVTDNTDCNDNDDAVHPGAVELCNGSDDNCNGTSDEGFIYSTPATAVISTGGNEFCEGLLTTLTAVGGSLGTGADWYWYEDGCGSGASIGSGVSITITPSPGGHTYYVRAEGTCGSTSCSSASLMVNNSPVFSACPLEINLNTSTGTCATTGTYAINVTGTPPADLTYEFSGVTTGNGIGTGSGAEFNTGVTTVMITASNECGTDECSFEVHVTDTEDPLILNCPVNIELTTEEGQLGAHVNWSEPDVTDNCGMQFLSSSFGSGDFFVVGTTPVTYTATDIYGNTSSCSFSVTVSPPEILGDPNISLFANDIIFSDDHPDPGTFITVFATIHNYSNYDVGNFVCRLYDQAAETFYTDIVVSGIPANQSIQVNWVIETPAVPGFIPLQVLIDADNELAESNELDNQAVRPYFNGAFSFAGQIVVVANATPYSQTAGLGISICGNAYYDDVSVPLEDTSVAGAQVSIFVLETNQTYHTTTDANGNFCTSFLTSNTAGTYHFSVEVTDFTLTGDTTGQFLLTVPVVTCPRDLSLTLSLDGPFLCNQKYHIVQGASVTGNVVVYNGCDAVTNTTTLFISLPDGTPVPGPFTIPALNPGQSFAVALPSMTFNTLGVTYINATVDYYNAVTEANEQNNSRSEIIQVHAPLPDIVAIGGSVSSSYQCIPSAITFTINNAGGSPTGTFDAELEIYQGAVLFATLTQTVSSVPGLCSHAISFPYTPASEGQYYFHLNCDQDNLVAELSETNNNLIQPHFYLECGKDLAFYRDCGKIDVKPSDPDYPGTLDISTTIQNRGHASVVDPFTVLFNVAGNLYPVTVSPPIAPGATRDLSLSVPAPPHGNQLLNILIDDAANVEEYDENNNMASDNLCWEFVVSNIRCDGLPAMESSHLLCRPETFETRIFNQGLYEASTLDVMFEITGPGLPSGWNYLGTATTFIDRTCNCPVGVSLPNVFYYPQAGTYTVRITADPDGFYTECVESNNQMSIDIQVLENTDYAVYSHLIDPSLLNPDINESVTFNLTYKNEGCTGSSSSELYLEVDGVPLDSLTAASLAPEAINTYAMSQSWFSGLPGMHVVRSFIDHDGMIVESNELNNEASRAIIVGSAPDFIVENLEVSDTTPVNGQVIQIMTEVINAGNVHADATLRIYYVNAQEQMIILDQVPVQLDSMESVVHIFQWQVTDPTITLIAVVQDASLVETDYSNNQRQLQLTPFLGTLESSDIACAGLVLGSMEVILTGGQPPYFAQWSNGSTGLSIDVPSGSYAVSVSDANGSMVILYDTLMDLSLPVTWYLDDDIDGFGNPLISEYTCTQPPGYVGTGTDCNDSNSTIYPEASELPDGQDNDCDGLIDEGLNLLNVDAGDCEVVYYGYEPGQCHTLTVYASGGATPYTYLWSNGATSDISEVCPEETTIYSVTVTDANGFTATDNVTVQVIDVSCGNNNNKVIVCHIPPGEPENIQVICISPSAIPAHLDHGCYVGVCDATNPCENGNQPLIIVPGGNPVESIQPVITSPQHVAEIQNDEGILLMPNPANDHLLVALHNTTWPATLRLLDSTGKLLLESVMSDPSYRLNTGALVNGLYVVQIVANDQVLSKVLVISH
jgi:subtilase family serine protease